MKPFRPEPCGSSRDSTGISSSKPVSHLTQPGPHGHHREPYNAANKRHFGNDGTHILHIGIIHTFYNIGHINFFAFYSRPRRLAEGPKIQLPRQQQPAMAGRPPSPVWSASLQGSLWWSAATRRYVPQLWELSQQFLSKKEAVRSVQQRSGPQGPQTVLRQVSYSNLVMFW